MKKNGPWTIKQRTEKYRSPWLVLHEDHVIQPDGTDSTYGVIEMKAGVSVLAMDEKGDAYLTREFRYAVQRKSIEVVSGGIDAGESPLAAAKRELKEELGIKAKQWISLGVTDPLTAALNSPVKLFLAKGLTFTKASPESNEQIEMIKLPFEKVVEMVMKNKITHAQSCVLILKAAEYLRNV